MVSRALRKNNFHREKTARELGITRGGLFEILEEQMPELYDELNFGKREWSPSKGRTAKAESSPKLKLVSKSASAKQLISDAKIQKLNIPFEQIVYPDIKTSDAGKLKCFFIPREKGEIFGQRDEDAIVLIDERIDEVRNGKSFYIVRHNQSKIFICAFAGEEQFRKTIFLRDSGSDEDLAPTDYKILGSVIAYCPAREATGDIIIFRKFSE